MHTIDAPNVNVAYVKGLKLLDLQGEMQPSRAGEVIVVPAPVTTCYNRPQQRVLFEPERDANPFFHLMESLWMLVGRNDATWLDQFVNDFSKRFSEDGTQHGAYGHRWRTHFIDDSEWKQDAGPSIDQLQVVVDKLKADPFDRRVVIQMWDPEFDLIADKRDIPCNLCIVPRIVSGALDITVMCRSNDAIWGAYGANAVHFSVLQEYLAAMIGVRIGRYYQISNNFHAYKHEFMKRTTQLARNWHAHDPYTYPRPHDAEVVYTPIVTVPNKFDEDLRKFFNHEDHNHPSESYSNPFFSFVAVPMLWSYRYWRAGENDKAIIMLAAMEGYLSNGDWYVACKQWYDRRLARRTKAG